MRGLGESRKPCAQMASVSGIPRPSTIAARLGLPLLACSTYYYYSYCNSYYYYYY